MESILLIVLTVLLIVAVIVIFILKSELSKKMTDMTAEQRSSAETLRNDVTQSLQLFKESIEQSSSLTREMLKDKIEQFDKERKESARLTDEKIEALRLNVGEKLETIRSTVDEKLEKTLTERLGKSFDTVGKQLLEVQKGLGEMQNLAQDVGGLKKVLGNVKMRGGLGEVQLSMLLEQILAPAQYEANVHPKPRSQEVVEFAIKLPGKEDGSGNVWLPIDAKFPRESYERLQQAYDTGEASTIEAEQASLYRDIKKMASDIKGKYIQPPHTTDFAIMFLPFEGIYAEVTRSASLLQEIQAQYKVIVTGPTTLAALLNSLQMGFKTLAIQKRSSEVWTVLAGVKKEFETFGDLLAKAKNNIQLGLGNIETLQGVRTRQIESKLKNVEVIENIQEETKLL